MGDFSKYANKNKGDSLDGVVAVAAQKEDEKEDYPRDLLTICKCMDLISQDEWILD